MLKRNAEEFIGLQETRYLLEQMESRCPELVKEIQRVVPTPKLAEILGRMVQEGVSIRNLRAIVERLIDWGQKEKDPIQLTEHARAALKRYISYRYSGGQNILAVYLLSPEVEETVRNAIRQTSTGTYLALEPAMARRILDAIKKEVGDISRRLHKPVLLTSMDIRRYVRKLIEFELYDLSVLSYQELTPEITIQPLSRITV